MAKALHDIRHLLDSARGLYQASEPFRNFKTECLKFAPSLSFPKVWEEGSHGPLRVGKRRGKALERAYVDGLSQNGKGTISDLCSSVI